MLGKNRFRKFITLITVAAIWCVYSTVALAVPTNTAGEITVSGNVTVNGQPAVSNSTILSGASIVSAEDSSAVISLGKAGNIQLAPNTALALSFHDASISGQLTSGSVTVLNAAQDVNIKTLTGDTIVLKPGETVSANGAQTKTPDKPTNKEWWIWVLIFGGAAVGVVWAAHHSNSSNLGGSAITVSPTR